MSDSTFSQETPQATAEATHDPFQSPVAPDIIDGAANNKAERDRHYAARTALQTARDAVKTQLNALAADRGHKVLAGAQIALASAAATLSAEIDYVLECIQHLPPAPVE